MAKRERATVAAPEPCRRLLRDIACRRRVSDALAGRRAGGAGAGAPECHGRGLSSEANAARISSGTLDTLPDSEPFELSESKACVWTVCGNAWGERWDLLWQAMLADDGRVLTEMSCTAAIGEASLPPVQSPLSDAPQSR